MRRVFGLRAIVLVALLCGCTISGCRREAPRPKAPSPRVVSLTPALTELLFDMGLGDHVVAVTNYCTLPQGQQRRSVGDAMSIQVETLLACEPDVVICQGTLDRLKGLQDIAPDILMERIPIESLADIPAAMERIGQILNNPQAGKSASESFRKQLADIRRQAEGKNKPRVLFVMGTDRPTVAAKGSFVYDLIKQAGGTNVSESLPGAPRWREATIEGIHKAQPEVLICQVFQEDRAQQAREYWLQWKDLPAVQQGRVHVVTDPHWTIPSGRLANLGLQLVQWLHPPSSQE